MKLREDSAPQAIITAAEVHIGRLDAHKQTTHLSAPIKALLDTLKAADADHHAKELTRMLFTGKIEYADDELDDAVLGASHKALDVVGRDRDDARYKAAFPTAPSGAMGDLATSAQDHFVDNVVHVLRAEPDFAPLSAVADQIEAAHAQLKALREAREAAYSAEASAQAALRVAQSKLIDAISSNRPRLELLFPKQTKRVRSFFA